MHTCTSLEFFHSNIPSFPLRRRSQHLQTWTELGLSASDVSPHGRLVLLPPEPSAILPVCTRVDAVSVN